MRLSLSVVSNDGDLQTGKASQITIQLSVDGAAFTTAALTVTEIGSGYYYVDIPSSSLACQQNVLIRSSCANCQDSVFEYVPDTSTLTAADIASSVWTYGDPVNESATRTDFRTLAGDSTHEAIPFTTITNNVWGRSGSDTTSRTLTTNIGQVVWNYGHTSTTPLTDRTVKLNSLAVGMDAIATEAYIDYAMLAGAGTGDGTGDSSVDARAVVTALGSIENKINVLPDTIWGRGDGDTDSRTLTSVVDLGIASEETVRILLGSNASTETGVGIKDVDGNTTLSLSVTRDSNKHIISIK